MSRFIGMAVGVDVALVPVMGLADTARTVLVAPLFPVSSGAGPMRNTAASPSETDSTGAVRSASSRS